MRPTRGTGGDRRFRLAGAALVLLGALLAGGTSGAFVATSADRGMAVTVAGDADSYLGIRDETNASGSAVSVGAGESAPIYSLFDNAGTYDTTTTGDVSAELVSYGDDSNPALSVAVVTDGGDADWRVEISCGDETRDLAAARATVELTATGGVTVVATRTTNGEVNPNCAS